MGALTIIAVLAVANAVAAQPGPEPEGGGPVMDRPGGPSGMHGMLQERGRERFDRLSEYLGLSEEQQQQAKALFEDGRKQREEMFEERAEQRREDREKMRETFEQHRKQFESLLTEEQLARLKEFENERKDRREEWMEQRGEQIEERLDLTADQEKKFEALSEVHRDKVKALHDKIKDEAIERGKAREMLDGERDRYHQALSGVLSEEQMQQFDKLRRPGRGEGRPGMRPAPNGRPGAPGFGPEMSWQGRGQGMMPGQGMGPRDGRGPGMGPGPEMDQRGGRGPGMRPGPDGMGFMLQGLRNRLDLTDEQLQQFQQMSESAMIELFDKFAATLDKPQQDKLKELRERFKERREMRPDGPPGEE